MCLRSWTPETIILPPKSEWWTQFVNFFGEDMYSSFSQSTMQLSRCFVMKTNSNHHSWCYETFRHQWQVQIARDWERELDQEWFGNNGLNCILCRTVHTASVPRMGLDSLSAIVPCPFPVPAPFQLPSTFPFPYFVNVPEGIVKLAMIATFPPDRFSP